MSRHNRSRSFPVRTLYGILFTGMIILLIAGCEQGVPEILDTKYRMQFTYDEQTGAVTQQLAIQVAVESREIAEDISALNLFAQQTSLSWSISSEKLAVTETDDSYWIGSNSITAPRIIPRRDASAFPEGIYRVELISNRGDVATAEVLLPRSELYNSLYTRAESRFPALTVVRRTNSQTSVSLQYNDNLLILCYDETGKLIRGIRPGTRLILPGMEIYGYLAASTYVELVTVDPETSAALYTTPMYLDL